jgi:hypothetical protein
MLVGVVAEDAVDEAEHQRVLVALGEGARAVGGT